MGDWILPYDDQKMFEDVMKDIKEIFVSEGLDEDAVKALEDTWMKKFKSEILDNTKTATKAGKKTAEDSNAARRNPLQIDGSTNQSSSSDTGGTSSEEEDQEDADEEEDGVKEIPLNSDDDDPDDDCDMTTDNVIFCKYTNVKRSGRRWLLNLTSGVMQLNGQHSVFGEAQVETWF